MCPRNQSAHHHLVAELVVEGVGEEARDGGEAVDHIEREAAVVAQHHQQGPHVGVDLVHLDGGALQELQGGKVMWSPCVQTNFSQG